MDKFETSIKGKYQERRVNRDKEWPPCHSNKLVRLKLVSYEKDNDDNTIRLDYADLFKMESGNKSVKKILVEGDAGIGKTSLSLSISEDWAHGRLFQQFRLLLLLQLRHKKVATAGSLPELLRFFHSSQNVCKSVAEYLEENEGNDVLIIAEGWDELSESERAENTFLYELLFKDYLPLVSLIMTSRPSASAKFHRLPIFDRFVSIVGFANENIEEYIQSEFECDQEKADCLTKKLAQNTLVWSLCTVPLTCAIFCHLWRTLEEALPTTMTELYTKIILNVVLRNLQKNGFENLLSLHRLDALPTDLKPSWQTLCKFAYETIDRDQIIFSEEELADFFPQGLALDKTILCFGLLQSSPSILEDGCGVFFSFLHLTIQEYLAALHLVNQLLDMHTGATSKSNQLLKHESFQSHSDFQRFDIVWSFMFGIYFNVLGHSNHQIITPYLSYPDNEVVLCHCAFEAKNDSINYNIIRSLKAIRHNSSLSFFSGSTRDCTAIIYCIDKLRELVTIEIYFNNCNVREEQIACLADALEKHRANLKVTVLDLKGNELTNLSVLNLFQRASHSFQSLKHLHLSNNKIGIGSTNFFPTQPSFNGLSLLDLSHNPLKDSGMTMLERIIDSGSLEGLRKLLLQNILTNDVKLNATVLDTFLNAVSIHCHCLKTLDLSQNNLGVHGASILGRVMSEHMKLNPQQCGWLSELKLNKTNLGDEGLRILIENIKESYCFNIIYLRDNAIHATGVVCLVNAICSGRITLQSMDHRVELWLDDNPIGLEGVPAIGRLLSSKGGQVGAIGLVRCQLTTAGLNSLYDANRVGQALSELPQNDMIQSLYLDGNNFTGVGIQILAGLVYLCPRLQNLFTSHCAILSDDFKQLIDEITQRKHSYSTICNELHAWNLNENELDNDGLSILMELQLLSLFPQMSGANKRSRHRFNLMLRDNPVSLEMIKMLNKEWKRQYRLEYGSSNEYSPTSSSVEEDSDSSVGGDMESFCGDSDCDSASNSRSVEVDVVEDEEDRDGTESNDDHDREEYKGLSQEVFFLSIPCEFLFIQHAKQKLHTK